MSEALSPLRRLLCCRSNADRVAVRLTEAGEHVAVVATSDPLQPWRVIDVAHPGIEPRKLDRCA